ncbi:MULTISPECIES: type VI secretion system tube protein Hcp [unclassified Caballeronia]|uniref:Hcp family type VI secretion system effector n=1 Tax=unclassified Caballeronia TaxID=2646786 RepID=UPI00285433DC|nr:MULTISPECIES: type VI secretion system tube protein Hcp [unclassified Caballeronia]MDR5738845.1 type VI secretion system tube protein Hcp [Caballeronia sp. LZ016]MDR5811287.1 type VI secretion system tube protein Hcp [Caballeronia sp. LZ019]
MTSDIFIQIQGIDGESQDADFPKAIDVLHWEFAIEQKTRMHSGSGNGRNKAFVSDLIFRHELDRASPNLAAYCFQGKHIPEAKLTMRKAGGAPFHYYRLTMSDVIITRVWPSVDGPNPIETVMLCFSRVKQEYLVQNAKGGNMGAVTALIDLKPDRAA